MKPRTTLHGRLQAIVVEIARRILTPLFGKRRYQYLFESLHLFSLLGMNVGGGSDPQSSGEAFVLNYINDYFRSRTTAKLTILDVGANIGEYTSLLKINFGNNATIHSFEPSQQTFQMLKLRLGTAENVELHNFGLGGAKGRAILYSDAPESGMASVYKRKLDHVNIHMSEQETVEIETLDGFCDTHHIGHIHFLKLDVEGHEKSVLDGGQALLNSGGIDFIQFEFGCGVDSRTFLRDFFYLLNEDYRLYRILKDGLLAIEHYRELSEVFATTNYLAERRSLSIKQLR